MEGSRGDTERGLRLCHLRQYICLVFSFSLSISHVRKYVLICDFIPMIE
jgi:hypothetical protein